MRNTLLLSLFALSACAVEPARVRLPAPRVPTGTGCPQTSASIPKVPRKARDNSIDGWVQLQYDVDLAGEPVNAKVLDGDPKGVFDQAGIDSVMGSKFRTSQGRVGCIQVITFSF